MNVAVGLTPDWKQWEGELAAGEFRLDELLGAGAKSAVFRTRVGTQDRAIKLVPSRPAEAKGMVDRWMRSSTLDHPHLLKILKAGTWLKGGSSLAYLVTELGDENLGVVLRERPLTEEETLEMLRPVAGTLAFLHGRGLTLGNLRPSNIFSVEETLKLSSDNIAEGDPSADLRAVAATLTEALTQKTTGSSIEQLPGPFREIARGCIGANGQPAWTAAELVNWRRTARTSSSAGANRAKARPKITTYAIVTAAIFAAVIVVGSIVKNRGAAQPPAPVAQSAPQPVAETPAVTPPAKTPSRKAAPVASKPAAKEQKPEPAPVQASSGSAQAVQQPLPDITDKARRTIHGTVVINVKVTIDE